MRTYLMWAIIVVVVLSGLVVGTSACGPPWIDIIEPDEDADVSAGCKIVAKVLRCSVEVKSVEFLVDFEVVGTDDTADEEGKYSFQWDAADAWVGEHLITAQANLANDEVLEDSDEVKVVVKKE